MKDARDIAIAFWKAEFFDPEGEGPGSMGDRQFVSRIEQALKEYGDQRAQEARNEALEEAATVATNYAERNARGERCEDIQLAWVATYHRIAGENIRDEIRALKELKSSAEARGDER